MARASQPRAVRFGAFEVDLQAGELRKAGLKVKLQEQPFQVLTLLLDRAGEVVTREELRQKLWSDDTFVDFEHSLGTAIKKIRKALGDSAHNPRFLETLPMRGYRFLASVERLDDRTIGESKGLGEPFGDRARAAPVHKNHLRRLRLQRMALVALLFVAGGSIAALWLRGPEAERPLRRFAFRPSETVTFAVISPNGKHIAYIAGDKLWVQDLDREEPREIEGPEGAFYPFWSPDSEFIGFTVGRELRKISVTGGPAISLCPLPEGAIASLLTAAWSPDGSSIVFAGRTRLYEVPARGGAPELLIDSGESEPGELVGSPHFLPFEAGGRKLLFTVGIVTKPELALQNLETGERQILVKGAWPFYSPSGHLLYHPSYEDTSVLFALPFSLQSLQPTGEAFPIAENAAYPSIVGDGTLVYLDTGGAQQQLVWRDRGGNKLGEIGQPQRKMFLPSLSPDGRFVAVEGGEGATGEDVWVHDVGRPLKTRLTLDPARESWPVWSPDGTGIAFFSDRAGGADVYIKAADGSAEAQAVLATPRWEGPEAWSPNGEFLLVSVVDLTGTDPKTGKDLWYLKRQGDSRNYEAVPYLRTPFEEVAAEFSPDGRYVAYLSDESGQFEVYVRPFPEGKGKWQISTNGGVQPRWSKDGKEVFYVKGDTLMAVSVSTTPTFSAGPAKRLFANPALVWEWPATTYDVAADGQRFVLIETREEASQPVIRVVQNWAAEFSERKQD